MPPNTVYVGRPTKWGNPWRLGDKIGTYADGQDYILDTPETVIRQFRFYIGQALIQARLNLNELKGKNLACWCPLDQPCHADVLIDYLEAESRK